MFSPAVLTDWHVCVGLLLKGTEWSDGLWEKALSESGSVALHTAVAFARGQEVKQTMGGVSGVSHYFGSSAKAASPV